MLLDDTGKVVTGAADKRVLSVPNGQQSSPRDYLAEVLVEPGNYSLRFGVNNVLDQDPPLNGATNCPAGPCNQNVWAQMYDVLGRYFFMGITADF